MSMQESKLGIFCWRFCNAVVSALGAAMVGTRIELLDSAYVKCTKE